MGMSMTHSYRVAALLDPPATWTCAIMPFVSERDDGLLEVRGPRDEGRVLSSSELKELEAYGIAILPEECRLPVVGDVLIWIGHDYEWRDGLMGMVDGGVDCLGGTMCFVRNGSEVVDAIAEADRAFFARAGVSIGPGGLVSWTK